MTQRLLPVKVGKTSQRHSKSMVRRKELGQHNLVDVTCFRDQGEKYSRSREVIRVVIDGLSIKGEKINQCMNIGGLFMQ